MRPSVCASLIAGVGVVFALAIFGCGQMHFDSLIDVNLEKVVEIRDDSSLSSQQKRDRLADYGISDVVINGLLADVRTGNQFGGTLTTAYDKVVAEQFSDMTPDEIQLYGDATAVTTLSDAAAQAISDLFVSQSINTPDELEAYLDDVANELDTAINAANLRAIFVTTEPDSIIDLLP